MLKKTQKTTIQKFIIRLAHYKNSCLLQQAIWTIAIKLQSKDTTTAIKWFQTNLSKDIQEIMLQQANLSKDTPVQHGINMVTLSLDLDNNILMLTSRLSSSISSFHSST